MPKSTYLQESKQSSSLFFTPCLLALPKPAYSNVTKSLLHMYLVYTTICIALHLIPSAGTEPCVAEASVAISPSCFSLGYRISGKDLVFFGEEKNSSGIKLMHEYCSVCRQACGGGLFVILFFIKEKFALFCDWGVTILCLHP